MRRHQTKPLLKKHSTKLTLKVSRSQKIKTEELSLIEERSMSDIGPDKDISGIIIGISIKSVD